MNRDYYKVFLVSTTGKGKTYSFRNMNPETTGFINIEDKPLPFVNKFKYHSRPTTTADVKKVLKEYADNPAIMVICIDSFSEYVEILLNEARTKFRNFDVWNHYNEEIGKLLTFIKSIKKEVFITGHYEILGIEGAQEKRIKVKGKEWEGLVEKAFTVVLYGDNKFTDKNVDYFFNLIGECTSAKCPPGLFGEGVIKVENDCNILYEKIQEFVK